MKSTAAALLLLLVVSPLLLAGSCGDGSESAENGARPAQPLPELPAVDDAAKARFALERLLHGPLPRTGAFAIPKIHQLNLEHSRTDLATLGPATVEILSDPELRARLTRPQGDHNPWQNILQTLAWLDPLPLDLAMSWCRPALAANDLQLHRRAVRALAAVEDGLAVAPLILEFFELRARDRELAPIAFRALVRLGEPWYARAVEVALRKGTRLHWGRVPTFLQVESNSVHAASDALAWWALLTDVSGPTEARGSSRSVTAPWYEGRLIVDDAVWPRDPLALNAAVNAGRVLAPANVLDAGGTLPESAGDSYVLRWREVLLSGRGSAADARCKLAEAGHAAYVATVERDLVSSDPLLTFTAESCRTESKVEEEALENARIVLESFLEDLENRAGPSSTGVVQALQVVLAEAPDEGVAAALGTLRHARPHSAYQALVEAAHDLLVEADPDALAAAVASLLRSEDPEDRAAGLLLARRGRDRRYAPLLDDLLSQAAPADVGLLQRLLIWVHTGPGPADGEARRAFAARYAAWISAAPDAEARGLAPGLLDLGAPGAAAYAAGLAGERRPVFVQGLLGRTGLVPLAVAAALLAPVDATTSADERRAVLVAAYRVAPTVVAPHLAALRARIAPGDRGEVDDVLAVVRHRAER